MTMMSHPVLTRGIVALRADASGDPKQIFAELQKSFEAFKAEHAAQLTDLRKGQEDVVRAEKVDRINAAVGELQAAMDAQAAQIAALRIGGTGGASGPVDAAYTEAFRAHWHWRREPMA